VCFAGLDSYELLSSHAGMVLNAEKRRQFATVALQLKAALRPSTAEASAPATSAPGPSAPALVDQRQKGVVEVAAYEEEHTCSGLIFKRKRKVDVVVLATSSSDDRVPSYKEHPPSASSPCDLIIESSVFKL